MKNHAFAKVCIQLVHSCIKEFLFLLVKIEFYPKTETLLHYNTILCFPATVCFENEQERVLFNYSNCHTAGVTSLYLLNHIKELLLAER